MNKSIGSTWGKWDFHVHTPYSILNNNFGFNPFEPEEDNYENNHEKEFDTYVKTLFNKAIENNIVAIGITDYFTIEGYKRIKEKYLNCPEKLKECFPDEKTRNKIKDIYVFPNIEFRIEDFVGKNANSVNYHVIFSGDLSIKLIEENFLHSLQFEFGNNTTRPLTMNNIKLFGESTKKVKGISGNPYLIGFENITVSSDKICNKIKESDLRPNFLVAIPVDENLSKIPWTGRDYTTRRKLYYQADCYMTSSPATKNWALAKNEEQSRIEEFGSIKPCIWGSDAHDYDTMFNPAKQRHCWIKAQPSFEGLLQILYEPETRVVIQEEMPFIKDNHQLIKSIQFDSNDFSKTPIEFNDSLICIIGGKSTGKSLLLRNIAHSIDPIYAKSQESIVGNIKNIENIKSTVLWKDGTSDNRKFVYIPQTFLNRTIDDPERETAIDAIIADVLLQNPKILKAHEKLQEKIKLIKSNTFENIISLEESLKKSSDIKNFLLQNGRSMTFVATIDELRCKRLNLANKVDITQDDISEYTKLKDKIEKLTNQKIKNIQENDIIDNIKSPVIFFQDLISDKSIDSSYNIKNDLDEWPELVRKIEEFKAKYNLRIAEIWQNEVKALKDLNIKKNIKIEKDISELNPSFEKLKEKVEQNEQLKKLAEQIKIEEDKLQTALKFEKKEKETLEKISLTKKMIINSQKEFYDVYTEYCSLVNSVDSLKNTELSFSTKTEWKKKTFSQLVYEAFDNRCFTSFNSAYNHTINDVNEQEYNDKLLYDIWKALLETKELRLKGSYTFKTALQRLFDDWYNIHYTVTSGTDTIADMSPGKKALALLELLINLKDTECPILIDQPEDDLDNRSIYNELVRFIKEKKCERQIIVVTHNANVVLGADAEQVIVANQFGKDTPNNNGLKFEYRSGAIEDNYPELNSDRTEKEGILSKKGIQTQICDILEGGKPALELRRNKYTSNKSNS
ncbi:MAG: hypothetical protein UDL61_05500 [Ruminococcus callidus]|uniref:TrlF family AAA-like ATPase n=2 Tax=Ruminococcus TaxID=1263 RepID=UPI002E779F5E|nr:hypothetical protein [Ruminococcus callidus]MEE0506022.1 hypothetical protein [Ruminococcus callidus]